MNNIKNIVENIQLRLQAKKSKEIPFILVTPRNQRFLNRIDSMVIRRKLEKRYDASQWFFGDKSSVAVTPVGSYLYSARHNRVV